MVQAARSWVRSVEKLMKLEYDLKPPKSLEHDEAGYEPPTREERSNRFREGARSALKAIVGVPDSPKPRHPTEPRTRLDAILKVPAASTHELEVHNGEVTQLKRVIADFRDKFFDSLLDELAKPEGDQINTVLNDAITGRSEGALWAAAQSLSKAASRGLFDFPLESPSGITNKVPIVHSAIKLVLAQNRLAYLKDPDHNSPAEHDIVRARDSVTACTEDFRQIWTSMARTYAEEGRLGGIKELDELLAVVGKEFGRVGSDLPLNELATAIDQAAQQGSFGMTALAAAPVQAIEQSL